MKFKQSNGYPFSGNGYAASPCPRTSRFRRLLKSAVAGTAYYSGLLDLYIQFRDRCPAQRRLFIVGYHAVVEETDRAIDAGMMPQQLISKSLFEKEIDQIGAQFDFLSIDQAVDFLEGKFHLKRDSVVVTFDDGYRGIYDHAYPVLKKKGVPAIFYLCSDYVGTSLLFDHDRLFYLIQRAVNASLPIEGLLLQRDVPFDSANPITRGTPLEVTRRLLEICSKTELDGFIRLLQEKLSVGGADFPSEAAIVGWDEVKEMAEGGMTFGSHTASHCLLTEVDPKVVMEELRSSKASLEARLDRKIEHLAYPDGRVSPFIVEAARACGYRSACTTAHRVNRIGGNLHLLGRELLWENSALGWSSNCSKAMVASQIKGLFKTG
ncbi:MAG: polysaccharide deacetylase family protein [Candidatus Manganitrophus sp.]|nr:polysaccharide deacetylase family protein [Candidatus Manganitrophus sp.]WDT71004.1 MAG: polysaccharide deacetylase family protein [Candidatus Manganitrophus sp.]WDT81718.1 MAG: polysaccharide deacetylase family protein [Candidatus Manganitrophus sp.]